MLGGSLILAEATRSHYRVWTFSPAAQRRNALLCFQSITHSLPFVIRHIPNIFCALRTLCEKHPGVGVATPFPIADFAFSVVTPMKSKRSTNNIRNHLRIKTFHDTPGGWGLRTCSSPRIRHFTRRKAKLSFPVRSFLGGAL